LIRGAGPKSANAVKRLTAALGGLVLVSSVVLALWAFAIEPGLLVARVHSLALPAWPAACDGLRVAVIADLHTGSPHTHGGQVYVPGLGRPIVPSRHGERYAIGPIVEGGRHLFVSPGIGTSVLPVRFLVPPELSILELRGSASDPESITHPSSGMPAAGADTRP
jgi:predicted MPP superfamily phosphohydrolase